MTREALDAELKISAELRAKLSKAEEDWASAVANNAVMGDDNERLRAKIKDLEEIAVCHALECELRNKADAEVKRLTSELGKGNVYWVDMEQRLRAEVERLKADMNSKYWNKCRDDNTKLRAEVARLKEEVESHQKDLLVCFNETTKAMAEVETLGGQNKRQYGVIKDLRAEVISLKDECEEYLRDRGVTVAFLAESSAEVVSLKEEVERLKGEVTHYTMTENAENNTLRALVSTLRETIAEQELEIGRVDEQQAKDAAEIEQLAKLREYMAHKDGCLGVHTTASGAILQGCTCGLRELLKEGSP